MEMRHLCNKDDKGKGLILFNLQRIYRATKTVTPHSWRFDESCFCPDTCPTGSWRKRDLIEVRLKSVGSQYRLCLSRHRAQYSLCPSRHRSQYSLCPSRHRSKYRLCPSRHGPNTVCVRLDIGLAWPPVWHTRAFTHSQRWCPEQQEVSRVFRVQPALLSAPSLSPLGCGGSEGQLQSSHCRPWTGKQATVGGSVAARDKLGQSICPTL